MNPTVGTTYKSVIIHTISLNTHVGELQYQMGILLNKHDFIFTVKKIDMALPQTKKLSYSLKVVLYPKSEFL